MINGVRLKVCGITSLVDAELADACGADYLGFILHAKSPRFVALEAVKAMAPKLPPRKKVAVSVSPTPDALREQVDAGFEHFQIHFPHDTAPAVVAAWKEIAGKDRLWLAPKLPPAATFREEWLQGAGTILWDTFHADGFGGSGKTGDWDRFRQLQDLHASTQWILAGGLSPVTIRAAIEAARPRWVDVNSGVESAPGVKDTGKLKAFVTQLHEATKASNPAYRSV